MVTTPIVVVGAGGFAREVVDVIEAINSVQPKWRILGLVADPAPDDGHADRCQYSYLGTVDVLKEMACSFAIGIGDGPARRRLDETISSWGHESAILKHPTASVGSHVEVGPGTILCAGVRITTNVVLGRHVHVNLNSTIGHDARLADYVTVNPLVAVSGRVRVGTETMLGTGAVILERRQVGDRCVIGAGAVLNKDTDNDQTLVGVPAKPLPAARG
jgi:sugar O-acyltransferase (sialic acid O-acetyltransferase NeuD family)